MSLVCQSIKRYEDLNKGLKEGMGCVACGVGPYEFIFLLLSLFSCLFFFHFLFMYVVPFEI